MHILATFATLCCQTRWPRNHSCTTQEHVSFFRTFSDIFGNFDFFRLFRQIWQNAQKLCAHEKNIILHVRQFCKREFTNAHMSKNVFTSAKLFCKCAKDKCANLQMCEKPSCTKCANLQRKLFSKCRNHKSALCTNSQMQLSAHVTISSVHNFDKFKFVFTFM